VRRPRCRLKAQRNRDGGGDGKSARATDASNPDIHFKEMQAAIAGLKPFAGLICSPADFLLDLPLPVNLAN
jgi:hypothetical protein